MVMKNFIFTLSISILFSLQGFAQEQTLRDSLIKELSNIHKQSFINGFSVGIVANDSILFTEGFGFSNKENGTPYTKETIQNIASISKTVIGVALLKAQELGKLKLDDPINVHLPFDIINPYYPDRDITIRHLATHTSSILDSKKYWKRTYVLKDPKSTSSGKIKRGLNDADTAMPLPEFLKRIFSKNGIWYSKKNFRKSAPGELFEYSNIGAALAAYIIEVATEQPFPEFTQTHIFDPLGMNSSGWSFETIDFQKHTTLYADPTTPLAHYKLITYPDGGLITSSSDLCRFLKELMKGYQNDGSILTDTSYTELFTTQLTAENFTDRDEKNPYNDEYNTGIFMGFSVKGYIGHTGGDPGVASYMFFDSTTMTGRILIINTDIDKKGIGEFYDIWNALKEYEDKL